MDLGPSENTYATVEALRRALEESCRSALMPGSFQVRDTFRREIEVVVETHDEGVATVSLEPYFLHSVGRFGILASFRFHPHEAYRGTKRALQLSLALDRNGHPNLDFYADRYAKLSNFVREFHGSLFPLRLSDDQEVEVGPRLVGLPPDTLAVKRYVMDGSRESKSQFMGVQRFGPYGQNAADTQLYFLYRREDHALSQYLFRALRGDTFRTFSGMGKMFRFPVSRDNVRGATISEFERGEIERVAEMVAADAAGRRVVPVVITPFSRHDEAVENEAYWTLKHAFLARGMPIQVVASETVADRNKLKWSTSGIALQIFAKAGGTPWRVVPATERCLIVGVGQGAQEDPAGRRHRPVFRLFGADRFDRRIPGDPPARGGTRRTELHRRLPRQPPAHIRGLRPSVLEFRRAQHVLDPKAGAGQHCRRPPCSEGYGWRRALCVDEVQ